MHTRQQQHVPRRHLDGRGDERRDAQEQIERPLGCQLARPIGGCARIPQVCENLVLSCLVFVLAGRDRAGPGEVTSPHDVGITRITARREGRESWDYSPL